MCWDCVHGGKEWLQMMFKYLHEILENELMLEIIKGGKYYNNLYFTVKETKAQKINLPSPKD